MPNGMKEERFRTMFAAFGTLTDCTLKFTKDGKFRKFGFVGFKSEEDANKALIHFHKSFMDTSRVTVEMCKSFGDPTKPKAWSKHTLEVVHSKTPENTEKVKNKAKKKTIDALENVKEDEGFKEFLSVHQNRSQAPTWANDTAQQQTNDASKKKNKKDAENKKKAVSDDYLNFDSDDTEEEHEEEELSEGDEKEALTDGLSDMEYLRSKVSKVKDSMKENDNDGEYQDITPGVTDSAYESGERDNKLEMQSDDASKTPKLKVKKNVKNEMDPTTEFTVKLRGVPFNVKEQQIREFMTPLKPAAIRIGRNESGNRTGYVYVDLHSEEEVQKALKRNKDYIGGRYIEVFSLDASGNKRKTKQKEIDRNFIRKLKEDEGEEDLSESGRLFVRNLSYTCTEEEIKELFSKHGPLSEVLFPIDPLTKRPKGFSFVTYMIPENAVTALAKLDGHIFQGRILHVLPSTIKKEKSDSADGGPGSSSYKRQKDAKNKASSSSSHNWNTLFLGTSAVADAIAEKYNTTKSQVLDHETKGSVAVRMALGETQIVQETRQFLLDNDICLDSFSQAAAPRSTSVILVKNLPAGVTASELEELFSPHGSLGRVLLPPSGLTAVIEFLEPTEAKRAFSKLAYSKFHHIPLYLEWAPVGVFVCKPEPEMEKKKERKIEVPEEEEEEEEEEDEEHSVSGSTLFIKNLNFITTEETLQEKFAKCGKIIVCTISKKKDKAGKLLSMGYGFVQYQTAEAAQKAIRQLQHCNVDDHQLELKISERATRSSEVTHKKKQIMKKQMGSKILVRNVPFQASVKEIRELFCTFGELKTVRLPRKATGSGNHRGFGFVDFITKQDAKKAFGALCHSTHLYGRRLVLEWADAEDTVETLRRKTAEHFHVSSKKQRKSEILEVVIDKQSGQLVVVDGFRKDFVAWANFTDSIKTTGWSFLEVTTNSLYNDSVQAYAAGAVEAAVTSPLIYKHWMNTLMDYCGPFKAQSDYCNQLKHYISTNLQWVQAQIEKQPNSPYWYQVRLALLQLKGLEDSYNDELSFPLGPISFNPLGFLLFQMGGDLEDLEAALNKSSKTRTLGSGSCSALIKLLPNNNDLLVSHDTWNTYQAMLRIMKKYIFPFKSSPLDKPIPGATQAFSSYPGSIFSGDDFYILSSGLVTLETTIGNSNPTLWDYVQPTGTVMEWLRNIVANRLALTGKDWADIFSQYNSGTYNNQWMIVDYKHFTPGKMDIEEELFLVLEQIPGMVLYEDKTKELMKKGFWASYNIPYYGKIFNASGCNELVDKFGPWFSLDKNPRAQIFHRNQSMVTDIESMIRLMRYNNFKEDPLSKCESCDPPANAENSISARSDLNPANGTYPFGALKQRPHGGTDMKLTSYQMYQDYGMLAPKTNLRDYVANKPPGVTFFLCLLILVISFTFLSFYSSNHTLPNPDVVQDWNRLLSTIAEYHFFSASQLHLEGNKTFSLTLDFSANENSACLTVKWPYVLSVSPMPPACPENVVHKKVVYTKAKKVIASTQKCHRLQAIYDPTLQVMLTKEDQIAASRHLLEVAVVLLGVCLILFLFGSLTHSINLHWEQQHLRHDLTTDD
uniref:RRM domain-containing protein n=1 Tax=Knipowitschia caucasica TaxID=637954 RepID=A0AAV2MRD7_KNICA